MKAATVTAPGGLDRIRLVDLSDPPSPSPGEVLVRLHAGSLNRHDYSVAAGHIPTEDGRILLSDGAGMVEAVGEGVTAFSRGDSVVSCFFPKWQDGPATIGDFAGTPGDGVDGYARELVVRPADWFTRSPGGYNHQEAATLTTAALTAWRALQDGGIKAGDVVMVLGTGGVSIFALQFARAMGASVIATSSSDEKLERLTAMGAEHVINYARQPNWGREAFDLTDGRGVDNVIEVGGPATLAQSIEAVRVGGQISLIGALTGIGGNVPTLALLKKQARIQGMLVGSRQQQMEMVEAIERFDLRPVIDRSFPLAELAEAFAYERSGAHFGKIAIAI